MPADLIRLNKFLANQGVASRRKIDELIKEGRITVNSKTAKLGESINPTQDVVMIDGKEISKSTKGFEYIILNKPLNVLSSSSDDRGRKTVVDLIKSKNRLYPVGRLDYNSTGLILLTNDGDLALKLTHPRYHVPKTYVVKTKENITTDQLKRLGKGIEIYNQKTTPAKVEKIDNKSFKIILYQGLKRQIREMCKAVGLTVEALHRTDIGPINIGNLKLGEYRRLTKIEIEKLKSYAI